MDIKKLKTYFSIKNLIFPQDITYDPGPEGCGGGGVVILKDLIFKTLNYVE